MFDEKIKIKGFLVPSNEKYNCGFGQDFAKHIVDSLEETEKYIISNVLEEDCGFGFWINIKKERFWLSINLLNALEFMWEIKIKPVGIARLTFFCVGKTFRGQRIVDDLSAILTKLQAK